MMGNTDLREVKWLYLSGRGAGIDREQFPKEWKGHAELSGIFPQVMDYFRDSVIYSLIDVVPERDFIAMAALKLHNEDAVRTVLSYPDAVAVIHPDEVRVFGQLIGEVSFAAHEEVIVSGPLPPIGENSAFAWVTRKSTAKEGDFISHLVSVVGGFAGRTDRAVINWRHDGLFPNTVYHVDAVVELYGGDAGTLKRLADSLVESEMVDSGLSWALCGKILMNWELGSREQ